MLLLALKYVLLPALNPRSDASCKRSAPLWQPEHCDTATRGALTSPLGRGGEGRKPSAWMIGMHAMHAQSANAAAMPQVVLHPCMCRTVTDACAHSVCMTYVHVHTTY